MHCRHLAPLIAALVIAMAVPAVAQSPQPLPAALPLRFESWRPASPLDSSNTSSARPLIAASRNQKQRALLGGAIGAATGVVFCTAFSTLVDDSADGGLSFCPLDSYLLFGGAGFVLGAAIGWLI